MHDKRRPIRPGGARAAQVDLSATVPGFCIFGRAALRSCRRAGRVTLTEPLRAVSKDTSPHGYFSLHGPAVTPAAGHDGPIHTPVQAGSLQLDLALRMLDRAGHSFPESAAAGSPAWLQSLIDGLCTLSSRDPLTGLPNRRQFEAALEQEIDRVARSGEPAMLLMLDIDHFKHINDTHGHAVGDLVIQAVGAALEDSVRPMDSVARIGGEEFAAVLPSCPAAFGHTVAERVRRNIEALRIAIAPGQIVTVTTSVGGAFAPQWVRSSGPLWLERADQQLYRAKSEGRNRTCLESPPISEVSAEERGMLFGAAPPLLPQDNESAP
jgi:diguanylate cyclase (GGDEF)-like protein